MSSHEQYLIGFFSALDLEDEVVGVGVGDGLVLELQFQLYFLSPGLHPGEHIGIFNCDGCDGDLVSILDSGMD